MIEGLASGARLPGCHSLAVCSWVSYLTSLCLICSGSVVWHTDSPTSPASRYSFPSSWEKGCWLLMTHSWALIPQLSSAEGSYLDQGLRPPWGCCVQRLVDLGYKGWAPGQLWRDSSTPGLLWGLADSMQLYCPSGFPGAQSFSLPPSLPLLMDVLRALLHEHPSGRSQHLRFCFPRKLAYKT